MSRKNNDQKGRFRSKTIAFRVSPEEDDYLNRLVAMSGLTKQDYLINRVLDKTVLVNGNPRVFKALKKQMNEIIDQLNRLNPPEHPNSDMADLIRDVSSLYIRLLHNEEPPDDDSS